MINRLVFYQKFKTFFGAINESQLQGLNFLLDKLDASTIIDDAREYAYILATIKHECAEKWQPISEMGSQSYLRGKHYYPFYGRGFVQLTWEGNYDAFSKVIKQYFPEKDIKANPDQAKEPEIAWIVLEEGMTRADLTPFKEPNFVPGQTLEKYFNDNITDWVGARHIINGSDCANLIAGYAKKLYDCIEFVSTDTEPAEEKAIAVNPVEPDIQLADEELQAHQALLTAAGDDSTGTNTIQSFIP